MRSRVFWNGINYSASGYMLNADGDIMDRFPGKYRFLMYYNGFKELRYIFLLENKFFLILN